jgi:DNA polymerase III epsilon subunit family exonuclease
MKIIPFQDFIRRFHSGEEFVVFDTETTGLNTFHDDIIEIAGVIWHKDGILEKFEELIWVNPNKVTNEAQAIHGITPADLNGARKPEQVLDDFVKFSGNRALVAHNIKFDFDILNSNLVRSGLKPYQNDETACSLAYAKEQMMPGRLIDLATYYKVNTDSDSLHRAMYDVNVLTQVLNKIMKENEPEDMQYSLIL